jgi:hypothetical protein
MAVLEPRVALLARLDTLQRHAAGQAAALENAAQRAEALALVDALHRLRAFLESAAPGPGLDDAGHVIDSASLLLGSRPPRSGLARCVRRLRTTAWCTYPTIFPIRAHEL